VVGDGRPFIGALVTIGDKALRTWKKVANKPAEASVVDLHKEPDLVATLQSAVDHANKAVSAAEAIKKFRVLTTDFTKEAGALTSTLKVKRHIVRKTFSAEVEDLYRASHPSGWADSDGCPLLGRPR
jgi:long-chain acyl-CoA synthetase